MCVSWGKFFSYDACIIRGCIYTIKRVLSTSRRDLQVYSAKFHVESTARSIWIASVSIVHAKDLWRFVVVGWWFYWRSFPDFIVHSVRESHSVTSALRHVNPKTFPQNKPIHFDKEGSVFVIKIWALSWFLFCICIFAGKIEVKPDMSYWEAGLCHFVGDCKYKR
jgi:hypothetical protein